MSKGKKSKRQISASPDSRHGADNVIANPPAGEQRCAGCRTWLDESKTLEKKCWLCGVDRFIDPTDVELQERKKSLEQKQQCCPNPACERPPQLVRNTEKYCSDCGATLEKATIKLWLHKYVEPSLNNLPEPLANRSQLIDAAWQLGLGREKSEARLDEEIKRFREAASTPKFPASEKNSEPEASVAIPLPRAEAVTAPTQSTLLQNTVSREAVEQIIAARRQKENEINRTIDHLRWRLRVKYGVVTGCVLFVALFLLAVGLRGRADRKADGPVSQSSPAAPSPAAPSPSPTPAKPETPPNMVLIEGGTFTMGRNQDDGGDEYESPAHEMTVPSFYMDVHEVTRAEYQTCVVAGICPPPYGWTGNSYPPNTERWPVTGVTWINADLYAKSIGKRLPTEEEWEFAARGRDGALYPWGDAWKGGHANIGSRSVHEVGRYQSYLGLFDLVGNAQEWTSSKWQQYPDKRAYISTREKAERLRVIRGGSFKSTPVQATLTYRDALRIQEDRDEEHHYEQTGFRCVQNYQKP
jgi:formylglycine-generating enzyme required for sulfatase activity